MTSAIGAGASIDATDALGWTALIAASAGGHREIVQALLRAGAQVNHKALDGWTALAAGALGGHASTAEDLLAAGAQRENPRSFFGAASIAAALGHRDVLQALVARGATLRALDRARYVRARLAKEGYRVRLGVHEQVGGYNYNPFGDDETEPSPEVQYVDRPPVLPDADLALAGVSGPGGLEGVTFENVVFRHVPDAFEKGAKPPDGTSVLDGWEDDILLTARLALHLHGRGPVSEAERLSLMKRAARAGHLSIVRSLVFDTTPDSHVIGWAASSGHVEIVRVLVELGGDVDRAVGIAARAGRTDVVRVLLEAGARIDTPGGSALLEASYAPHLDAMRLLLENGAAPDAEGDWGSTPLLVAAEAGSAAAIRLLLDAGASVNRGNARTGATALMSAAHNEHRDAVRALLDGGADVDRQDHEGQTALMRTVRRADYANVRATARMLLEAGASRDLADKRGWTALTHAIRAPSVAMVELLVAHGADVTLRDAEGRTAAEHARTSPYPKEIAAALHRAAAR